jgi:hypothetical protein
MNWSSAFTLSCQSKTKSAFPPKENSLSLEEYFRHHPLIFYFNCPGLIQTFHLLWWGMAVSMLTFPRSEGVGLRPSRNFIPRLMFCSGSLLNSEKARHGSQPQLEPWGTWLCGAGPQDHTAVLCEWEGHGFFCRSGEPSLFFTPRKMLGSVCGKAVLNQKSKFAMISSVTFTRLSLGVYLGGQLESL